MQHAYPTLLALGIALCAVGCEPNQPASTETAPPELAEAIIGTWETVEIEIKHPTYGGSDSTVVDYIREGDWTKVYGVQPARTEFTPDGKLRRTHRMRDGRVADITNGLWKAREGDSLMIIEPNVTFNYGYVLDGDRITLRGLIDNDRDGELDDQYRAELRLVSRTQ